NIAPHQTQRERWRGLDRAQHPEQRLGHDLSAELHPIKGELVPGHDRVNIAAHTQTEEGLTISLLVEAARHLPWPVARNRRASLGAPVDAHGMAPVTEDHDLGRSVAASD